MTLHQIPETTIIPLSLWKHDARFMSKITISDIIERVAEKHGFSASDLKGRGRRSALNIARQEAMYEAYLSGRWSYAQIGRALGGRDHTTVLFGVRRHAERWGLPMPVCVTGSPFSKGVAEAQ